MDPTASSSLILPPGTRLQNFRIVKLLGRGGFGAIYLANDISLGHRVAIKEYLPGDIAARAANSRVIPNHTDHERLYQWGLDRFVKEARNLVRFRHPNIVRVSALFQENNTAYMVMDFEQGVSLREFAAVPENREESRLKMLIKPIAMGLSEVHRQGFIHRDIKPGNLLVRNDGSPVLLDFGSARLASRHATHGLTALVSSGYAPLEQYNPESEEQQGPWSDIYALGGVLYFCLSQRDPADSTQRSLCIVNGQNDLMPSAMELGKGRYSEAFLQAIDWALSVRIADRPQMLGDWIPALFARDVPPDASITTQRFLDQQTRLATDVSPTPASGSGTVRTTGTVSSSGTGIEAEFDGRADTAAQGTDALNEHSGIVRTRRRGGNGTGGVSRQVSNKKLSDVMGRRPGGDAHEVEAEADGTGTGAGYRYAHPTGRTGRTGRMGKTAEPASARVPDTATRREQENWNKAMAAAELRAVREPLPSDRNLGVAHTRSSPGIATAPTTLHELAGERTHQRFAPGWLAGVLLLSGVTLFGWLGYRAVSDQQDSQRAAAGEQQRAADAALATAASARQEAQSASDEQRERERLSAEQAEADEAARQAQAERDALVAREQAQAERLAAEKRAEEQLAEERRAAAREAAEQRAAEIREREQVVARRAQERAALRARQNVLLDEANSSIAENRFVEAQARLDEAIALGLANPRIETLAASLALAEGNARQPISDQEFNAILGEFHQLKEAIEAGNMVAVYRLTDGGDQAQLFSRLIDSFERIEMSITGIRARDVDKSIVGTLRIDRMIRENGNRATPSPSYQDRIISSQRIDGVWSDIRW